ncbi:MAG: protein translocase subunit SecF [Patescibacteria group bacterium]
MVQITKYRNIYYYLSGVLVGLSILSFLVFGLNLGVDFKGGSLIFGEFQTEMLSKEEISESLAKYELGDIVVQPSGERGVFIRIKEVSEDTHQEILVTLNEVALKKNKDNKFLQKSYESVGPSVSSELSSKAINAVAFVLIAIVLFVAFAFRKVSYPLSSWKYGLATLVALFHDVIIPVGVFALLGYFYNIEISSAFIAAILTVLGYSVHDTIIVFDRVRENLMRNVGKDFEETVNISVNQTFVRSLNTSLTVVLVLISIYLFGGESIKYFALTLIIGIVAGTYSSIFVGSNVLVSMEKRLNLKK